ncbi:PTS sugar transporter subunit IIC [Erysipelothrix anatis]|uniref:PTS sugar transporter subunit IIC n=1 Tax=Erysipelothrix anatis TaxID=2683713 RepID=UPI0013578667|nr:PTS transporter subunit EIIC [Erysipelothrix anatis]
MEKLTDFLNKHLVPIANAFNRNKYLLSMRDAFLIALPFTMFGSLFTAVINLPFLSYFMSAESINVIRVSLQPFVDFTMGSIALIIAASIGYNLSKYNKVNQIYGAILSLISYLAVTANSTITAEGLVINGVIPMGEIGAMGMFTAIIIGLLVTEIYSTAIKKKWTITMPESVPTFVAESFFSFIPVGIAFTVAIAIRIGFQYTEFGTFTAFIYQMFQTPLSHLGSSLWATILVGVLVNLFWFFGIHGHIVVASIMVPIWTVLSVENFTAFNAGQQVPNLVSNTFADFFVLNGQYISYPIIISLLFFFKKREDWKQLGKIALVPGIFGVYEPLIFGLPVMLNPILLIPLLLTPIITTTISYLVMSVGWVPYATGIALPYTMPSFISGFLVTNSWRGAALQLVLLVILTGMWYLFLRVLNQSDLEGKTVNEKQ